MTVRVAVSGAAGKMGRWIIALASGDEGVNIVAALERPESPAIGLDAGESAGVAGLSTAVGKQIEVDFDVMIDFSTPAAGVGWLNQCVRRSRPFVTGTTGYDEADRERFRAAAESIPVLKAPNMSVGVSLMLRVARQLAEVLDASYDIEITEAHHRLKVDAPSGTALALRDAVIAGRTRAGAAGPNVVYGRRGRTGPRPAGEIAVHTLRTGDVVGEHTVSFGGTGETLTIGHSARSRDIFAAGAIRAAKWIVGRPPGLYDMSDVLFGAASNGPARGVADRSNRERAG